jgi:outer membrane receptor protein involved in Fe transport
MLAQLHRGLTLCAVLVASSPLWAQQTGQTGTGTQSREKNQKAEPPPPPTVEEYVQVTATRVPEPPADTPGAIEVFSAQDLVDRGATDLRSALALAGGVDMSPGGDGGPASYVPEFWGLRELDAFLLVVDGVPWGGAYNPALSTINLNDVERIEVQRGAAPVMYGATSFVGVIQIVHRPAGAAHRELVLNGGSFATGGAAFATAIPEWAGFSSSLAVDFQREGFRDDRTSFRKSHVLWRNARAAGEGQFRFDVDYTHLDQNPASPHPREGGSLTDAVPLDANHNPDGAFFDENRFSIMTGYDRPFAGGRWSTSGQLATSEQKIFRGFLSSLSDDPSAPNARGIRENIDTLDLYADTHLAWSRASEWRVLAGFDYIHGNGDAEGADFDYFTPLSGATATHVAEPSELDLGVGDRRDFIGVYTFGEWYPVERLRLEAGVRLNRTDEEREGEQEGAGAPKRAGEEEANHQENTRLSGSVGAAFTAWKSGFDRLNLVAMYKNTFKPAAFDFGLAEGEEDGGEGEALLKPETASSYELGVKGRLLDARLSYEVMGFLMDFENLVIAQIVDGLPSLTNGGKQRFKGVDFAVGYQLPRHWSARATYGYHDARFTDYLTEFDGEPAQIAGHRLEMSPHHQGSAGLTYAPPLGLIATVQLNVVGSRYLNKRNTALADSYATFGAGVGYRTERWELRLDAQNLNDTRPPVSESELGDSQYYRLTPRRVGVSATFRF